MFRLKKTLLICFLLQFAIFLHSHQQFISIRIQIYPQLLTLLLFVVVALFHFWFLRQENPVCSPGWPWTQKFSCLILPSARIINVSHHAHDTVSLHVLSWFFCVFKNPPGSYAQLCSPSYLENWDRKMADSMPAWVIYWDPVSKRVSLQGVWGYWAVLECSPSMHESLNPIHSTYKINKQIK